MDKFDESLTAAEFKKNSMRETLSQLQDRSSSLLLFSLRWEDLEAHYESLHKVLLQRKKDVHALEESVQCRLRCIEERCREFEAKRSALGVLEESMKVLREEVEARECEFSRRARLGFEAKGREIEEKVEVLESVRREIAEKLVEIEERERRVVKVFEDRDREVESRGKELEELWKKIEKREAETKCRDRELEKKEKELEESRRKINLREMEIKPRNRELENKEKALKELLKKTSNQEKEIESKDREFGVRRRAYEENVVKLEERLREVERKERESGIWYKEQFELLENRKREGEEKIGNVILDDEKLKERCGEIELQERKLDERVEEVDLKEKRIEELAKKLESNKRELEEKLKEADLKEQRLDERLDKFGLEKREFEERFKEGIVRERRLLEGIRELEIREEQLQERNREINLAKKALAMLRSGEPPKHDLGTAAGIVGQHCVVMDGKALQIFLNEHWEEHDKMRDTVSALLRYCPDPAKLVLDAIVGFYPPPHLKHRDHKFDTSVVRNSCLLLLDELMEIGLNITPHVKGEAMKLSFDWITKMSVDSEHSIEVVAFLELVGAYRLADAFDENELLDYAENVAHHRQIPKLCRALGLAGRIPGLIQALLERERHLVALGFIVEFDLVDEFPLASLLDDYIKFSEHAAEVIIREGNNSFEAQNQAMAKRIAMLKDIIKCIEYHDVRPGFSAASIEQMIDSLKQKALLDKAIAPIGSSLQTTESNHSDHDDPPVADAASDLAHISASAGGAPCTDVTTIASAPRTLSIQRQEDVLMEAWLNPNVTANTSATAPIGSSLQTTESNHSNHNDRPVADAASDLAHISASAGCAPCTDVTTIAAAPLTLSIQQQEDMLTEPLSNPNVGANTSVRSLECLPQVEPIADKGSPFSKPQLFPINEKGLMTLLGENVAYELVRDEILCVLKSSSDPAHLVLDAMKNDPTKMMGIPVKGCILLLEDVKKLSPVSGFPIKAEARQCAKDWISKLELKKYDHLEVICFMQFLLVYNLCRDFEDWEVYGLLDPFCWLKKFADSCQLLGLSDLLPNFVENLIANKCLLRAIGYICTFKLDDKFPPESLLNNYMMNAMKEADIMCEVQNASPADQIVAMNRKISVVKTALKYVDRYGIGSEDMRICLQGDVEQLEKLKTEKTRKLDAVFKACGRQDDVKTLRMLLSRDTAYKSVENEICRVLKSSPEPAHLVLNTIKNVESSHLEGYIDFELGFPIKNCILLLEQLRSISPKIKRQVRDEAIYLKKRWIKKLKQTKDDHMGVLCFIMLHKVYNQSVKLNPADVSGLLNPPCWKLVSESCQKLGLPAVHPESLIRTMIANKQGIKLIKAIKYILEFQLDDKFSMTTLLNEYLFHSRKNAEKICGEKSSPEAQAQVMQMKIDAARIVVGCVQEHNLYRVYPLQALEDEIERLSKQKEEACQHNESSSRGLKRDRMHRDPEDEKSVPDTCSSGTRAQKKKKQNARGRSQQRSSSYDPEQPPPPPPFLLLPASPLPRPHPLPLTLPLPPRPPYPYNKSHMNGPNRHPGKYASSPCRPSIYPRPRIL